MSLVSTSSKDDIKSIFAAHPGLVILNSGSNPSNAPQAIASITIYASTHNVDHLLSSKFNITATSHNTSDKLSMLEAQEAKEAEEHSSQSPTPTSPTTSPRDPSSSSPTLSEPPPTHTQSRPPPTQVKMEYGPLPNSGEQGVVTYTTQGPRTTSIALSAAYFSDPLQRATPGIAEPPDSRKQRLLMWAFITSVCYHHPHLRSGLRVGDIYGIVEAIRKFGMSFGSEDTLDGISAMATLTKKGRPWQDFANTVALVRNVLDRESDPRWQIGDLLLPGFILRAMEADPKFDVELTLLRRIRPFPGVDHIMATLGTKARELSKGTPTLSGFVGTSTQSATPTAGKELCRKYASEGYCKFDDPSKGRWCRHSHGADEDVKRMAAKKAFVRPPAPPQGTQRGAKPKPGKGNQQSPPDGCYRCGSKNHGIDDCTEEVKASVAVTPTPLPVPPAAFNVNEVAAAIAQALQHQGAQATGMVADPLGVGPNNIYGAMDHELAKLFTTKPSNG
jgi:hypothetical protein